MTEGVTKLSVDRLILLLGAPRSGTSWLGTIFDSHPGTTYLHEPDSLVRDSYSHLAGPEFAAEARSHLERLLRCRHSKSAGSRPIFHKAYRNEIARWMLRFTVYGIKGAEQVVPSVARTPIPLFASDISRARPVLKSVSLGRVGAWRAAVPEAKVVLLIRHPCGHVASVVSGQRKGRLPPRIPLDFANTAQGQRYGITREMLGAMPAASQAAWRWAILNEKALDEAVGAKVIRYEDLCADPIPTARELFRFCNLEWHPQTESYIEASTSGGGGGFFDKRRIPVEAANRWRSTFADRETVWATIKHTKPAALFMFDA